MIYKQTLHDPREETAADRSQQASLSTRAVVVVLAVMLGHEN
jgi:hypothetical protein